MLSGRPISVSVNVGWAIVFLMLAITIARNEVWRSAVTLWEDVAEKSPAKLRPHLGLANAYRDEGRWAIAASEYGRMIQLCNLGVQSKQLDCEKAINSLASIAIDTRDLETAHQLLDPLADSAVPLARVYVNLGVMALIEDDAARALDWFQRPIVERIDGPLALFHLGNVFGLLGRCEEAVVKFEEFQVWFPDFTIPPCAEEDS